ISEKGQSTVKEAGFVSQNIIEGSLPRPGNMPREFVEFTRDGKQLSLSFRFKSGSITLDNKAKRDVDRLVLYMKQKKNAQRKLMLFGFSDSKEIMPIRALVLSTNRADTVANVLMRRSLHPARVRGYGSVAPVASNGTAAGREKNRRVDVWIQ
ncbi:MAG: OmpA family protein, partial [Proteobacteria bacterium]|nr:OmpA family protein [Pseudomonadota bacterium]